MGYLNKLEISDDDLVEGLKTQVLPFFSQFRGQKKFKQNIEVELFKTEIPQAKDVKT